MAVLQCQGTSARSAEALMQRLRRFAGSVDCQKAARRLLPSLSANQLLAFANGLLPAPARPRAGSAPVPDVTELLQVPVQLPAAVPQQQGCPHVLGTA